MKKLPEGWKISTIQEITNNLDGKRVPLNNIERDVKRGEGKYPYWGANNELDRIDEYIFDDKILCVAEDGGSWGLNEKCAYIVNEKCWVNNHAHVLTAKENLILEYLLYYLNKTDLTQFITGSTRGKLTKGVLNNIPIILPPLKTQKQIAAVLDKADELRQKRKQANAKLDEFLQSTFFDLFGDPVKNPKGWRIKPLKEIISRPLKAGHYLSSEFYTEEKTEDTCEMVHMSDAFYEIVQRGKLKRVKITKKEQKDYQLNSDDILICRRSLNYEGSAKPCRIPFSIEPLIFESSLIRVTPDKNIILPLYLYFYFSNDRAKKNYVLKYVTKSTISGINQANLNKVEILIPPLDLQTQFAQIVEKVEEQKAKNEASAQKLDDLFNTLLQRAFNGELEFSRELVV